MLRCSLGYQVRFFLLFLYITMSTIRDIRFKLNQKALDALCTKDHIPACVHPLLHSPDKNILQSPDGKIGIYLFAFIRHSDPNKVRIGDRELAECEVGLLKMTEGRIVPLSPPATTALEDSGDSIDKLIDDANQEHVVEKSDDVLGETIAKDASAVVAEKARKKQKREVAEDASGSTYPPKKLMDDHQSLLPDTGGKSLAALRGMVPDTSAIPSRVTKPLIAASVAHVSDVGPLDSVFGPNLRICPPHVRYVVSSDGSHHSGSYSETNSFVRSPTAKAPIVTIAVTTTVNADVAAGSKAKDVSKDFENIGDSTSAGGSLDTEIMHRVYIPRWKVTNDSALDDPYVCCDLTDLLALPALFAQLCTMDYGRLYSESNVGAARQDAAKSTELRDLKEQKFSLEGERVSLSERVTTLESVTTSKEAELASLSSQVAKNTVFCSLESAFELFKERIKALQDEQANALGDRVVELDAQLSKMSIHLDEEFYPRFLTTISGRLEDNVVFAETSLSSSLEIVDLRLQRFREEAKEKHLSLTDVMTPFVEPLSSKSLTGEASSFAAPVTTLSTTFASSVVIPPSPVVSDQVLDTEPHSEDSPFVTFEKEELSTSLE
nr:hypothetical protein [Tanacetum cinerariifolium]